MNVRIRFTKLGKVRFTSHRDLARILERAARRAELPLTYSQGFSPRPKLSFGLALPTGCESRGEYADLSLDADIDLDALPALLSAHLPPGIDVTDAEETVGKVRSLQDVIDRCTWRVEIPDLDAAVAAEQVARVLALDSIVVRRHRKGREVDDDIRPGIVSIDVQDLPDGGTALDIVLLPRGVRPGDLLGALDASWEPRVVRRQEQLIATADGWREPLTSDAGAQPHAHERAS